MNWQLYRWYLLGLGLLILGFWQQPAQAQTLDYHSGKTIQLTNAGVHYTLMRTTILKKPYPKFSMDDKNELERFLIIHFKAKVSTQNDNAENIYDSAFSLRNGPNDRYSLSDKEQRSLKKAGIQLLKDGETVKPGHQRQFDIAFVVYPHQDNVLSVDFGSDHQVTRIYLDRISSQNGVTPDH